MHKGLTKNAIDLCIKEGTPILSSHNGIVVAVKDDSNEGGLNKKYLKNLSEYMNKIEIKHANGETSGYYHIKFKSAKVKVGDKVKKGEIIALSGNTEYSSEPHLHFMVVKNNKSLKIRFEDFDTNKVYTE